VNEEDKSKMESLFEMFKNLKFFYKEKSFNWVLVGGACHPEMMNLFNIKEEETPAIAFYMAKKK